MEDLLRKNALCGYHLTLPPYTCKLQTQLNQ